MSDIIQWIVCYRKAPILFKTIGGKAVAESVPIYMATKHDNLAQVTANIALHWHEAQLEHVTACKIINGRLVDTKSIVNAPVPATTVQKSLL